MKKIVFIAVLAFICQFGFSQTFDMGFYGSANSTWLLNKNVNDDGDEQDVEFTVVPNFGINVGIFFTETFGIETGVSFGKFSQKYVGSFTGGSVDYTSRMDLKTTNIPFLLKLGKEAFFEFGIQYSSIGKATYTYEDISGFTLVIDRKSAFKSSFVTLLIGFGGNISITDWMFITPGLRLGWSFSDVEGTDAFGNDLSNKDDTSLYGENSEYGLYRGTNPAQAGFRLGVTFRMSND